MKSAAIFLCTFIAFLSVGIISGSQAHASSIDIQRLVTPAGIEIWFVEEHSIPVIAVEAAFRGAGARNDPQGKEGLAYLTSGLLDEGAGDLDSASFQEKLEDLALRFSFSADKDNFSAHLYSLSANRDEAFRLLGLALQKPRFDEEPLDRVRTQVLVGIERGLSDPDTLASLLWWKTMLPDHAYGRRTTGTSASVKAINRDDLAGFASGALARDNLVVAVVGDVRPPELMKLVDGAFAGLPAKAVLNDVDEVAASPAAQGQTLLLSKPVPQSVALFGQMGIKRDDPDFIPAFVMNYIVGGGGFSARLTEEVREKRGLAYSVYSALYPLNRAGFLYGEVSTENSRLGQSLSLIKGEFARLVKEGVSEEELNDAKTYLTGSYPLRFDSDSDIAAQLLAIQLDRLGIDYVDKRNGLIMAVTKEDILRVAKRLIDPDAFVTVIVGAPQGLKGVRKVGLDAVE